jgi:hypothetical protein
MKGINGVQCQVHPKFLEMLHEIQNERIKLKLDSKSGINSLSTKRLSLTLYKLFKSRLDIYSLILNAVIDKNED